MNDSYAEVLIKSKKKPVHTAIQVVALVLTTVLLLAGFFLKILILLIPGIFLLIASNFLLPMMNVEYEYLYVAGELTIDKIMGRTKRKNCVTVEMDKIEMVAPVESSRWQEFGHLKCVENSYMSGREGAKVYACIYHVDKGVCKAFFEPDEKMMELMRLTSPRKVSLY